MKLNCDILLSTSAFKSYLRRYNLGVVRRGIRASQTEWAGRKHDGTDGVRLALGQTDPRGGPVVDPGLLAALLSAGLYPQLAYLHAPPTKKGPASSSAVKLHVRAADRASSEPDTASVHPSSVNARLDGAGWRSAYVAYHERVRTTKAGLHPNP